MKLNICKTTIILFKYREKFRKRNEEIFIEEFFLFFFFLFIKISYVAAHRAFQLGGVLGVLGGIILESIAIVSSLIFWAIK